MRLRKEETYVVMVERGEQSSSATVRCVALRLEELKTNQGEEGDNLSTGLESQTSWIRGGGGGGGYFACVQEKATDENDWGMY